MADGNSGSSPRVPDAQAGRTQLRSAPTGAARRIGDERPGRRSEVPLLPAITPVLAGRRAGRPVAAAGGSAPDATNATASQGGEPQAAARPQASDRNSSAERSISPRKPSPPPPAQQQRHSPSSEAVLSDLMKALKQIDAAEGLDEGQLQKLEARSDEDSRKCVQLARALQTRLQEHRPEQIRPPSGPPPVVEAAEIEGKAEPTLPTPEQQQLIAQIAFLERKVTKLQEKLRRKEPDPNTGAPADQAPSVEAQQLRRADDLAAEAKALQAETLQLDLELRSARERAERAAAKREHATEGEAHVTADELDVLKKQVADAQASLTAVASDKDGAEASARLARRLVEGIEKQLRDMVNSREAEQTELLAEQRRLRELSEDQARQLAGLDRARSSQKQISSLQSMAEALEHELAKEREALKAAAGALSAVEDSEAMVAKADPEGAFKDPEGASQQRQPLEQEEKEKAEEQDATVLGDQTLWPLIGSDADGKLDPVANLQAPFEEGEHKRVQEEEGEREPEEQQQQEGEACPLQELDNEEVKEEEPQMTALRKALEERKQQLEQALDEARAAVEIQLHKLEQAQEKEMAALQEQHAAAMEVAKTGLDTEQQDALAAMRDQQEASQKAHEAAIEDAQRQLQAKVIELEDRTTRLQADIVRGQRIAAIAKQQREFRGMMWLVVRRESFDRRRLLAVLSSVLDVETERIRIIDEEAERSSAQAQGGGDAGAVLQDMLSLEAGNQSPPHTPPDGLADDPEARAKLGGDGDGASLVPMARDVSVPQPSGIAPLKSTRSVRRLRPNGGGKAVSTGTLQAGSLPASGDLTTVQTPTPHSTMSFAGGGGHSGLALPALQAASDPARTEVGDAKTPRQSTQEFQCILLEIRDDLQAKSSAFRCGFEAALRLTQLLGEGDVALETVAAVSITLARGWTHPPEPLDAVTAKLITKFGRMVSRKHLVLTAMLSTQQMMLRLVGADDHGRGFELNLNEDDLKSVVKHDIDVGRPLDLVEAVVPALRVINRDGEEVLAAMQYVDVPPTLANRKDPDWADLHAVSSRHRQQRRLFLQNLLPLRAASASVAQDLPQLPDGPSSSSLAAVDTQSRLAVGGPAPGIAARKLEHELVYEELLLLEGHFVLLGIWRSTQGPSMRLTLSEAGRCLPFIMDLPRTTGPRIHRLSGQWCNLRGVDALVLAEELSTPHLMVRVAQVDPDGLPNHAAMGVQEIATVFLSTSTWQKVPPEGMAILLQPSSLGNQIRHFLRRPLNKLVTPGEVLAVATRGRVCELAADAEARVSNVDGLSSFASKRRSRRRGASGSCWQLLVQHGRRMNMGAEALLHLVRVYHRPDPYTRFLLEVYQLGSGHSWELLLPAEELEEAGLMPVTFVGGDGITGRMGELCMVWEKAAARVLTEVCELEQIGGIFALTIQERYGPAPTASVLVANEALAGRPEALVTLSSPDAPEVLLRRLQRSRSAVLVGGSFLNLAASGTEDRSVLHTAVRRIGRLDLLISLEALSGGRGHALVIYHPGSCTSFEVVLATKDREQPDKACVESTRLGGVPVLLALVEVAWPHGFVALVRHTLSGDEFRCNLRDDADFPMLSRPNQMTLYEGLEDILLHGTVGREQRRREVEPGYIDPGEDDGSVVALQLPFSSLRSGHPRSEAVTHLASLRFNPGGEAFQVMLAVAEDEEFSLALAKVGDARVPPHVVHFADRRQHSSLDITACAASLQFEICQVAGMTFMVLAALGSQPRSFRVAVIEVASGACCQLSATDSDDIAPQAEDASSTQPPQGSGSAHRDLLRLLLDASTASMREAAAAAKARRGEGAASDAPSVRMLTRATRRLASGQPVVLSVVRSVFRPANGQQHVSFRVLLYHPLTGREMQLTLPGLVCDEIMESCGLSPASSQDNEIDKTKHEISSSVLSRVAIHPEGERMELKPTR